jgi:hypothetical protein
MAFYYFGDMEFGDFVKGDDYYPVALIHAVHDTREFATEEEADDYMVEQGFGGYVDADSKNIEIYFAKK